jgi:D-alanyl-D-alanine carboxypeptidase (penicillin-binding protein 5/6)
MSAARLSRLIVLLVALALGLRLAAAPAEGSRAIVMDASTGAVLHEDNADAVSPPASVTKLMTFLVAHDLITAGRARLDTPITANAADQSMGGTQLHLAAGETFPVEELLHATMVESANDAAHALTQLAGGREAFVALMNARAQSLGMRNTVFRSPHGLPPEGRRVEDGDLTSPRDLALLARELVSRTDIVRYTSQRVRPFGVGVRAEPLPMRNHNKLLGAVDGCDGLKTGYTRPAGFCLVATAQRGTKRVIVVVLKSPDSKTRDAHVRRLIEEGFAKIPADSVFTGAPTALAPVRPAASATGPVPVTPVSPVAPGSAHAEEPPPAVQFRLPPPRR